MSFFAFLIHATSPAGETFIYETNTQPTFLTSAQLCYLAKDIFAGHYDVGEVTEIYEVRLSGQSSRIIPRTNDVALEIRRLALSELLSDPPPGGWTEAKVAERLRPYESLLDRFTPPNIPTVRSLLLREHV